MKKSIWMVLAMAGMLTSTACGNKNAAPAEGVESTTVAEKEDANKEVSLADIVAKAKAEGANWSVDEWKAQFRQVAIAIKPMAIEMDAFFKKFTEGGGKAEDLEKEGNELEKKYADLNKLLDEFNTIAKETANGKTVAEDQKWGEELFKELGIPSLN